MIRNPNLLKYLPQYVQEYDEIKKIMSTETTEIKTVEDETELVKDASFILYCGEGGMRHFEKLLGITPLETDTLEARRSRVLVRWNIQIPYTYKELIRRMDQLCGAGKYELKPNFNRYEFEIIVDLPKSGQVDELFNMLEYMLPANLSVITHNEMVREINGSIRGGAYTMESATFTIQTKGNNYNIAALLVNGGSITTNRIRTIN